MSGVICAPLGQHWMYTGRFYDEESRLYYYRARYYDPETARFLERDPLGHSEGPNLFHYVDSNPVNRVDPLGLREMGIEGYTVTGEVKGTGTIASQSAQMKTEEYGTDTLKYNKKTGRYEIYDGDKGKKVAEMEVADGPECAPKVGDKYKVKYYTADGKTEIGEGTWTYATVLL